MALGLTQSLREMSTRNLSGGKVKPVEWPPSSPDLIPLAVLLWGHLKSIVYDDSPLSIAKLQDNICAA
jgi:hypothetical protein